MENAHKMFCVFEVHLEATTKNLILATSINTSSITGNELFRYFTWECGWLTASYVITVMIEAILTTSLNITRDNELWNKIIHSGVKRLRQNLWLNHLD